MKRIKKLWLTKYEGETDRVSANSPYDAVKSLLSDEIHFVERMMILPKLKHSPGGYWIYRIKVYFYKDFDPTIIAVVGYDESREYRKRIGVGE